MKKIAQKKWVRVVMLILAVFGALQFIRPEISNGAVTGDVIASDAVKGVLRSSCYSCHSNEVSLSWFDKISPATWLVSHDIREGRKALNFSE